MRSPKKPNPTRTTPEMVFAKDKAGNDRIILPGRPLTRNEEFAFAMKRGWRKITKQHNSPEPPEVDRQFVSPTTIETDNEGQLIIYTDLCEVDGKLENFVSEQHF